MLRLGKKPRSAPEGLEGFDLWSLRHGAAALALWPPNADRHAALTALLTDLSRRHKGKGGRTVCAGDWSAWLTSASSERFRGVQPDGLHDAPTDNPVALLGQRRALLGGALEDPGLHFGSWMSALSESLDEVGEDVHLRRALATLQVVADLADRVIRRSDLGACVGPSHHDGCIHAPAPEDYERLCLALVVPQEELGGSDGPVLGALSGLIECAGQSNSLRPLALDPRHGLLVADPFGLTIAALVDAVSSAARSEFLPTLRARLGGAALAVAREAAMNMDWEVEQLDESTLLARADVDCRILLSVHVLADRTAWPHDGIEVAAACRRLAKRARDSAVELSVMAVLADGRPIAIDSMRDLDPTPGSQTPWVCGLAELRLLGDGLRRDPLALPMILERIMRPPWPPGIDIVDVVGIARRLEDAHVQDETVADGTEYLRMRARLMAARHPSPAPDGRGWVNVSRWSGSSDSMLFCCDEPQERFALLARAPGRFFWVVAKAPNVGRNDLAGVLCSMLAYWLVRLGGTNWPELAGPAADVELAMRFEVAVIEGAGPLVLMGNVGRGTCVQVGPGFVHELCRGDNSADRSLVGAVIDWIGGLAPGERARRLEELVPRGRGTFVIWPEASLRSAPRRLAELPCLTSRDRQAVEQEIVALLVNPGQILSFGGDGTIPGLHTVIELLQRRIDHHCRDLMPAALVDLVALHERAARQAIDEAVALPARAAIVASGHELDVPKSLGTRNLALRALIERMSAVPAVGQHSLSRRRSGWLRAAMELLLGIGATVDAVRAGHVRANVIIGFQVGIDVRVGGAMADATERMVGEIIAGAPDAMASVHDDWWTLDPGDSSVPDLRQPVQFGDRRWEAVDDALACEWGIGYGDLLRVIRGISNRADIESTGTVALEAGELVELLRTRTALKTSVIRAGLGRLTLGPLPNHDPLRVKADQPWQTNRARSYLRCPLVALPDGRLVFSSAHVLHASRYLFDLIETDHLDGAKATRTAVIHLSQKRDREFERAVFERCIALGHDARLRVTSLGGARLERPDRDSIGDIDVLVWSSAAKRVWLLEAKRLVPALVGQAIVRQSTRLTNYVKHHDERLRWVQAHRGDLGVEIDCQVGGDWFIGAALVIESPLAGSHLLPLEMPVWIFRDLSARLSTDDTRRGA